LTGLKELSLEEAKLWISDFYSSLSKAIDTSSDSDFFPFHSFDVLHFTAKESVNFWLDIFDLSIYLSPKLIRQTLSKYLPGLKIEMVLVMLEAKMINLSVPQKVKLISLFKFLLENAVDDVSIISREEFRIDNKNYGKLVVALSNYGYAHCGDYNVHLFQNLHGPYLIDGQNILVRDYFTDQLHRSWKSYSSPFKHLRIIMKTREPIFIDGYGHLESKGDFNQLIEGFQVNLDGVRLVNFDPLITELSLNAVEQFNLFNSLPFEEKVLKVISLRKSAFYEFERQLQLAMIKEQGLKALSHEFVHSKDL